MLNNWDRDIWFCGVEWWNPTIVKVESLEAAELVKLFNNTYRDIHFSIGNYFNEIAQSFNINGIELIKSANYQYERSKIANPGFVGGPCLEKDAYILVDNMETSPGKSFVLEARKYNEKLEETVSNWIIKKIKDNKINSIGLSGFAFKGRPATSDLRGSSSLNILKMLSSCMDVPSHFSMIPIFLDVSKSKLSKDLKLN